MAMRQAVRVTDVYLASYVPNIASMLRASLSSIGNVTVHELQLTRTGAGFTLLTEDCKHKIPQIEVMLADPSVIGQVLLHPEQKVKWFQGTFAGVELIGSALAKLEKLPDVIITRQTAHFGQTMAEYVLGHILARERNFPLTYESQKVSSFNHSELMKYRTLDKVSVGILGLGNIGTEVARQCKAVNMTVWAAVRDERFSANQANCEHVHFFRPLSKLNEMLQEVDYLVNILPSTEKTRGLLNGDVLRACEKKKTVFINIGRGDVIEDNSLIKALESGWLSGAILDVFNTEPLPKSSPLWTLPGVTITPHVSGVTDVNQAVKTFVENLQRYQAGEPLADEVDLTKGY